MSYDYSENILIQESAAHLLSDELGWQVELAYNKETLGKDGTFGRKSHRDVLLARYFQKALRILNPWLTDAQAAQAQDTFERHLSSASLMQINEEKYGYIRDGIPVKVKKPNGQTEEKRAMIIDFEHPHDMERNYFLAVKEMKVHGDLYHKRTDIVGFVNGIPLLFIELKKNTVDVQNAYFGNYTDYLDTIPHLFYYNAFVMLSNGIEAKVGTLGSKYEFFHEWKRLSEQDQGNVALETMLRGICRKENFMDLLENFILYDHSDGATAKILARNHQYLGVNEAVKAYAARKLNNGKLGVFWHTQGSGKSYSMIFLAQKIRRKFSGSPTIIVLTDREELNTQISDRFENCGMLGKANAAQFIATSGDNLIRKLEKNQSFIFTLIQKFNQKADKPIYPDHDIIIMSDEAHRTQNGALADNMMALLPAAARIGFTGTPLLSNDKITERTFGGYISIYDFKRAVDDGATVPLYYENRGEKILDIKNPDITDKILDAIEAADLDEEQQEKLEQEFKNEIHILTAEPRLRAVAKDFVQHYSDLWTSGKAMFVCLNKVTCVRMYKFVNEYWDEEIENLERQKENASQQEMMELERKLKWMKETEMAVVISTDPNEIKTFEKWKLDIKYHREKMVKRELDKEFKDSKNPLRVVFVCAMWLTGFDVKCLSCLYLDKPLKAHTLMQAIARANRVSEGKSNGLIIDYVGIVKALRKALADYTANAGGNGGTDPTIDKGKLIERILEVIAASEEFLRTKNFELNALVYAADFEKLSLLKEAKNAISDSMESVKQFMAYGNEIKRIMKYLDRNNISEKDRAYKDAIIAIFDELKKKKKHADNVDLMVQINGIIGEYIVLEQKDENRSFAKRFDISKIDFDLLRREFAKAKKKNLAIMELDELIRKRIDSMLKANPSRVDYYERYQKIITDYNQEQDRATIEKTFMDLMDLANSMNQEEQRYVREGFSSDEELSLYDMLLRESLSREEIGKIKKVAVKLLDKIKGRISELDHWTDKRETKAAVDTLIGQILWSELPTCYSDDEISAYRQKIYEYVYMRYKEVA